MYLLSNLIILASTIVFYIYESEPHDLHHTTKVVSYIILVILTILLGLYGSLIFAHLFYLMRTRHRFEFNRTRASMLTQAVIMFSAYVVLVVTSFYNIVNVIRDYECRMNHGNEWDH